MDDVGTRSVLVQQVLHKNGKKPFLSSFSFRENWFASRQECTECNRALYILLKIARAFVDLYVALYCAETSEMPALDRNSMYFFRREE